MRSNGMLFLIMMLMTPVSAYTPGAVYFGRNNYIEYRAGNLPIIISAPHGGVLRPAEIPDRTHGTLISDSHTDSLASFTAQEIHKLSGRYAHVVICRLHRIKVDCDRDIVEGAAGNRHAEQAWSEFQAFLDSAVSWSKKHFGRGLYLDIHGHAHEIQRIELGYGLSGTVLSHPDSELTRFAHRSTIRAVIETSDSSFAEILRGQSSFGGLLQNKGYPCVPSPRYPSPEATPYFLGGFNTNRYGSRDSGTVSSIHVECHFTGIRDTRPNREAFGKALGESTVEFLKTHLKLNIRAPVSVIPEVGTPAHDETRCISAGIHNGTLHWGTRDFSCTGRVQKTRPFAPGRFR